MFLFPDREPKFPDGALFIPIKSDRISLVKWWTITGTSVIISCKRWLTGGRINAKYTSKND